MQRVFYNEAMRTLLTLFFIVLLLAGCSGQNPVAPTATLQSTATRPAPTVTQTTANTATATQTETATPVPPTQTQPAVTETPTAADTFTPVPEVTNTPAAALPLTGRGGVPAFDHIIIIMFENRNYKEVIGREDLPTFNRLAQENVLFTHFYAPAHPSLPNYIALIGGSTFGITSDCGTCYIDQPSLPDLIEASRRTWKTYQEDLPAPCFVGYTKTYSQNHNPFIYFDPIRKDQARCQRSVVPLTQLSEDLSANQLPNFAFIMPNICNSAHSCPLKTADAWLEQVLGQIQNAPALGQNSMIFITFDEASADNSSCCGLPPKAGGRIPAIMISPLAQAGYQDDTALSLYSLLKTTLLSWSLPGLGFSENPATEAITAPWK